MENSNNNYKNDVPVVKKKIDKTTYIVGVHFSKTSKETLGDKIKRMAFQNYRK